MAPLNPIKKDKDTNDKRAQTVLEFAKKTADLLRKRSPIPSSLSEELDSIIRRSFPFSSTAVLAGKIPGFDSLGCELWNAATNILREDENKRDPRIKNNDQTRFVVLLRVFAFFLINTAHHASSKRSKDRDRHRRNFKIALKACRFCLDKGELELAHKVLEKCSEHVSASKNDSPLVRISGSHEDDEHRAALRALVAEFYLLRVTHAWKIERFDLAEHHFNQISVPQLSESASLAEKAADLFYEAGKSLFKKKLDDSAIIWLERAISALDTCDPERQSQDAGELRSTVTSSLVECLLRSGDQDSVKRACNLVEKLAVTHGFGNRMAVQLMHFNILLAEQPVRREKLTESLSRLLGSAVLTDRTFKTIMQATHRARRVSVELACHGLGELITARLLEDLPHDGDAGSSIPDYIEKACVTYALFATSGPESAPLFVIDGLQKTLDMIVKRSSRAMSPKATHATQSLIWKAASAADPDAADRWCDLLRHPLFDGAGQINKARIGRKAITTALSKDDLEAAREAFFQMPTAVQNESLTRYLAFKLALRTNDYDLANESLNVISKQAKDDQTFLYACVLEAQQSAMRPVAVAALQAILDKKPSTTHLPSLLRCTARLLIGELGGSDRSLDDVMEEVIRVFEKAAENIQAFKKGSDDHWRTEVQWWSKNAYNLSLQWCEDMHPEHLIRLLGVCTKFIDSYPNDVGIMHQDDLRRRKALCHFLCANALIVLGRSADEGSEYSLQSYLEARREIGAFKSFQPSTLDGDHGNLNSKIFELLKFDLECILNLQHWDQLNEALQACLDFKGVDRWDTLADIVLIIRQHTDATKLDEKANTRTNELLERIINDTWQKDKDVTKASRWLRLSFTVDLDDSNGDFALKLLNQAAKMAKKGYNRDSGAYPETELQWLATTAFNKAIDLLSSGVPDGSKEWMDGALDLARYGADNGALHANLTDKREQVMERVKEMEA